MTDTQTQQKIKEIKRELSKELTISDREKIKRILEILRIEKNKLLDKMTEKHKEIDQIKRELRDIELYKSETVKIIVDLSDVRESYDLEKAKRQLNSFVEDYISKNRIEIEKMVRHVSYYTVMSLHLLFEDAKKHFNIKDIETDKVIYNIVLKYSHFDRAIIIDIDIRYRGKVIFKGSRVYNFETEETTEQINTILEKYQNLLERHIKLCEEFTTICKILDDLNQLTHLIIKFLIF